MYDAYLVGFTCLFHAFSAGVCWRARRVAGLRTARCAANCADLCAASCAARSAEPCEAVCSLFKKRKKKGKKRGKGKKRICSSKIDELLHHFDANFEKLVQKIVTSANCLQFPEIPTKISEIFTERSAISVKIQQHLEKIYKITKNVRKSENFEM